MRRASFFLIFIFAFLAAAQSRGEVIDKITVAVNDEVVTEGEIERLMIPVYQRLREMYSGNQLIKKLEEARQNMVEQLQRLEAMDRAAKAKESAVEAMRQAGRLASAGGDASIDAVADRIQRRADVADARFERAMGEMSSQVEQDVVIAQAEARLAQRKARLAGAGPDKPA